jgi:integrase
MRANPTIITRNPRAITGAMLRHATRVAGRPPPRWSPGSGPIPLATFVGDQLAAHIAEHGTGEHGLILHLPDGRAIGRNRFGRLWRAARETAGAEHVDYHDLRHTFASTLLSEGVSVRAVAGWMGHASPMITLNTYAHMMPVDEDRGRSVLDSVLGTNRYESG